NWDGQDSIFCEEIFDIAIELVSLSKTGCINPSGSFSIFYAEPQVSDLVIACPQSILFGDGSVPGDEYTLFEFSQHVKQSEGVVRVGRLNCKSRSKLCPAHGPSDENNANDVMNDLTHY